MTEADIELVVEFKKSQLSFSKFCELRGLERPRFRSVVAAVNRFKLVEQLAEKKAGQEPEEQAAFAEVLVEKKTEEQTFCCVLRSKNAELHFSDLPPANWFSELFRELQ